MKKVSRRRFFRSRLDSRSQRKSSPASQLMHALNLHFGDFFAIRSRYALALVMNTHRNAFGIAHRMMKDVD